MFEGTPCLFYLLITVMASIDNVKTDGSIVFTNYGGVRGKITPKGRNFSSIPYAQPPIDYLRWKLPQEPIPWSNKILNATQNPPGCPQTCNMPSYVCPTHQNEDCLYLNIITPPTDMGVHIPETNMNNDKTSANNENATGNGPLLPVMIYIHGGSFAEGYGSCWLYNGTNLAFNKNVIVVTINYRLGVLGLLYDPSINITGNYGYYDIKLAIQWIKNNIEYFNGDPNNITVFGQGSGAYYVSLLLIDSDYINIQSSDADNDQLQDNDHNVPFSRVIMESNPIGVKLRQPDDWIDIRDNLYQRLRCNITVNNDIYACLMNKSAEEIVTGQTETQSNINVNGITKDILAPWTPTIDNKLFKQQVLFAIQNGNFVRDNVNIINGVNNNDGWIFSFFNLNRIEFDLVLEMFLRSTDNVNKVKREYKLYDIGNSNGSNTTYYNKFGEIMTDMFFKCPNHNVTYYYTKYNNVCVIFCILRCCENIDCCKIK